MRNFTEVITLKKKNEEEYVITYNIISDIC